MSYSDSNCCIGTAISCRNSSRNTTWSFTVLTELTNRWLNKVALSITTLATAVSESAETIEEVYEPFLIQQGFIYRTPRGREVTEAAYKHLGKSRGPSQGGLF